MVSVGSISLMGLPFFWFFSKERIVESIYGYSAFINIEYIIIFILEFLVSIVVICSVIYSMRLLAYVFLIALWVQTTYYEYTLCICNNNICIGNLAIASICCGYITEIFL